MVAVLSRVFGVLVLKPSDTAQAAMQYQYEGMLPVLLQWERSPKLETHMGSAGRTGRKGWRQQRKVRRGDTWEPTWGENESEATVG